MLAVLLLGLSLGSQGASGTREFVPVEKKQVPPEVLKIACQEEPKTCRETFFRVGHARIGDVNDDGVNELIVLPGTGGTGGRDAYLFQKRGNKWVILFSYFPYSASFQILPPKRDGYHDLRLASYHCFKWSGKKYIPYEATDYRKLRPEYFDRSNQDDAEILWLQRYAGLRSFKLEPIWHNFRALSSVNAEVPDSEHNVRWTAMFKDAVWGIQGSRAFLLLPRPDYQGCRRLVTDGDWLLIYGESYDAKELPVARYNRRTHELRLEGKDIPYWLLHIPSD